MKKVLFLCLFVNFLTPQLSVGTASDARFYTSSQPRSAWCNLMRASQCKNPRGFQKYADKGCIDDQRRESKCLQLFCSTNCAPMYGDCPTGDLQAMCKRYCMTVSFGNDAAQRRLNTCVTGSLEPEHAAQKGGSRALFKENERQARIGQAGARAEAEAALKQIKAMTEQRRTLFYVDGADLSKAGIVRIDDFIKNVQMAIRLTARMKSAIEGLRRSGQSQDILAQAEILMKKSDQEVAFFVRVAHELADEAVKLIPHTDAFAPAAPAPAPASE